MIRLRPGPCIVSVLSLAVFGSIAVYALQRIASADMETTGDGMAPARNTMAVVAAQPVLTDWQDAIDASGIVSPWQEAIINAQIGGFQIVELRADVGDVVQEGQVLAVLNRAFLEAQRAELEAKLERATADLRRASALSAKGSISEKDRLYAETEAKSAKALLELKLLEIKYATVVAPDAGVVVSRSAMLGQVSELGTELFRIIRKGRLEWRGEVAASDLARIAPGQKVEVDLPDGQVAVGMVRKISPVLDEATRRGLIYADLADGGTARAEMFTGGRIYLGVREALVVPSASLIVKDGRHYVAKIREAASGTVVSMIPVAVGRYSGDQVEIMDGLSANDAIVGEGAGLLNDGDRVRVLQTLPRE
ncbi:efflux RND transporter periplasmic adaptor subunit [Taklimakanibacter lacteus]|uniref:efflux RND transporter periplasmic adaptor subunit n=1 Tax=Taklimakanibacter lacteus TaxID=2268456 RepID=UPI0013C3ED03